MRKRKEAIAPGGLLGGLESPVLCALVSLSGARAVDFQFISKVLLGSARSCQLQKKEEEMNS